MAGYPYDASVQVAMGCVAPLKTSNREKQKFNHFFSGNWGTIYVTKQAVVSDVPARQASAQEIYSAEVDSCMIAAGMHALAHFESWPAGPGKTRAEMVARIYSAMEEIRRRDLIETAQEHQPVGQ